MVQICYACDRPKESREHVPPLGLFPERKDEKDGRDLRVNLITVPSCHEHNRGKSDDDLYLLGVFSSNVCTNAVGLRHAVTKLARAVQHRPSFVQELLPEGENCVVIDSATGKEMPAVAVILDEPRFRRTMKQIALGLYYKTFRRRWAGSVIVWADFVDRKGVDHATFTADRLAVFEATNSAFADVPFRGANPDVFTYQVLLEADVAMMRLTFYGGCRVTAIFGSFSEETLRLLDG